MPEALAQNKLTLPRGAECDACNAYAGNKLESNLIRYPDIALAIQLVGAPGKSGKSRADIGRVSRERIDPMQVKLGLKGIGRINVEEDGTVRMEGRMQVDPSFDFLRFRRALHHIGLNTLAAERGANVALGSRYDRVRAYVKNPALNESWPYAQAPKPLERVIAVGVIEHPETEFVQIHIFNRLFLVDLLNTGDLPELAEKMGAVVIPCDSDEPPPLKIETRGKPQ
jgi:hypothetical protein